MSVIRRPRSRWSGTPRTTSPDPFTDVARRRHGARGRIQRRWGALPARLPSAEGSFEKFTPEWAEEISPRCRQPYRRLAAEFAPEARIGSTIVVDGVTVPYRPVAAIAFRGSQGHMNSLYNFLAVDLLNHLVGAADVVGSCLGFNPACHGHPETGRCAMSRARTRRPDGVRHVDGLPLSLSDSGAAAADQARPARSVLLGMSSPFLDSDGPRSSGRNSTSPTAPR